MPPPALTRPAHAAPPLRKIVGFETTDYATLDGRVVWAGDAAAADHPRNLWRPRPASHFGGDTTRLQRGAQIGLALLTGPATAGLLGWLKSAGTADSEWVDKTCPQPGPRPLWLQLAAPRLDAVRHALLVNDLVAFEHTALRLLGLGPGLTPSGDDFIGGICFALHHAPRPRWCAALPAVQVRIRQTACSATNVISAALLDDLLAGHSHQALHDLLVALHTEDPARIQAATTALLHIGATSGADMLCGVLLALSTWQASF